MYAAHFDLILVKPVSTCYKYFLPQQPVKDQSSQHVSFNSTAATNTSFESQKLSVCDMCSNYEAQLVREQKRVTDLELKLQACEKSAERHREELLKEIGFRKEMEEKWNEKKEEHKQQVRMLLKKFQEYFEKGSHPTHYLASKRILSKILSAYPNSLNCSSSLPVPTRLYVFVYFTRFFDFK